MARTATTGKLLTKAPSAKQSKMAKAPVVDEEFAATWNGMDKAERRQIRRLVRIGRPQESVDRGRARRGLRRLPAHPPLVPLLLPLDRAARPSPG